MGRKVASILIQSPAPGSSKPEVHCGNLKRKNSLEEGWRLPFKVRSESERRQRGAGSRLAPAHAELGTPKQKREAGQLPRAAWQAPGLLNEACSSYGGWSPRSFRSQGLAKALSCGGQKLNGGALLCPHSEPLCLLSPSGF